MPDVDFSDLIPASKPQVDFSDLIPKTSTSPGQQMLTDFSNQGAAAGQRTTPVIAAHMPNLISDQVHENDAGEAMYIDPQSGKLMPTDTNKQVILRDPNDNKLKVFARTPETNEGMASSVGRLIGTGMAAGPVDVSKAVPAAIGAAERLGVDLPKAIATDNPLTRFTGQVVAKAPGGGPLQEAIGSSIDQLGQSVQDAAKVAGGTIDPAVAGDNFAKAIEDSFKPAMKSGISAAYDNVSSLINKDTLTPMEGTQGAVSDIMGRRSAAALEGTGKAVDMVAEAAKRPGGLTFEGIKTLRSHVGDLLDSGVFPEGMNEGELRRVYAGLSDDLKSAALNGGGPRAVAALERANELNKQVVDWKEGIKKIIGPQTRSGEGVSSAIIRMASNGAGADLETLAKARSAVPADVWSDIASTAINQLGKSPRTGEFSPTVFASDFRNLSDRGRALLFRSVGSGDVLSHLNDLAEVSQKFVDAGKFANTSGTAGHNALYAAGAAIAGGVAAGSWKEPLAVIASIAGINGISRLLASPATAASVGRWARIYNTAVHSNAPTARVGLEIASRNLANTAAANGVRFDPSDLMRSLQAPGGTRADQQQNVPRPPGQ